MLPKAHREQRRLSLWLLLCGVCMTEAAYADNGTKVDIATVEQRRLIEEVPLTGTVSSPQIAVLSTEVAGLVNKVHVDAGDRVKAGDLLIELDDELSEIDRDSARAAAKGARAAWEESTQRLADAEALVERRSIAASEVRAREAQAEIDGAAWQAADAEARRQDAEFRRHKVTAPFNATVSRKLAEVGEWLAPGAEMLELVATDDLRIDFQVPQRLYPRIDGTTKISLMFDAYPDERFSGRIHRKVPLSDNSARTFLVRVQLEPGSAPELIPGMSARATLSIAEGEGVVVPRDALLRYPDGRIAVWVVEDVNQTENTAQVREQLVTTGLTFNEQVEVRSGLTLGQQVVVRGNESLRADQTVTIDNLNDE